MFENVARISCNLCLFYVFPLNMLSHNMRKLFCNSNKNISIATVLECPVSHDLCGFLHG